MSAATSQETQKHEQWDFNALGRCLQTAKGREAFFIDLEAEIEKAKRPHEILRKDADPTRHAAAAALLVRKVGSQHFSKQRAKPRWLKEDSKENADLMR